MSKLTSLSFSSGVTKNDLIHIVITGDTSQNPLGSSYKASLGELKVLFPDVYVTGGTYSTGTATFTNNTGGTFNVNGFSIGGDEVYVTGGTYSDGTAVFTNTTGGTFDVTGFTTMINVTYSELVALIGSSELIQGNSYLITDFQTIYDQPDFDSFGNAQLPVPTLSGAIEPLIVEAVSTNEISNQAFSTVYENDLILYNWNFQATETNTTPAKGIITRRTTDYYNDGRRNSTPYDSRAVLFKRYESVSGSGIYNSYKDTGFASSNVPTFGNNCTSNYIGNFWNTDINAYIMGYPFILPNTVWGNNSSFNKVGDQAFNVTLGDFNCDNNNIGNYFFNNTIDAYFQNNEIGNFFANNTIGEYFKENQIGNFFGLNYTGSFYVFYPNTIGSNFQRNFIQDKFYSNNIGITCVDNNIKSGFVNNDVNADFSSNNISDGFENNTILDGFSKNTIGQQFYGNNVGLSFISNVIGNHCYENLDIRNYFQRNNIGDYFYENVLIDDFFQDNSIGNYFYSNTVSTDFKFNSIGNSFQFNVISGGCSKNIILNNFNNNTVGVLFSQNQIGNYFQENISIGTNFKLNQIGDYFYKNISIGNYFQGNQIGNYFGTDLPLSSGLGNTIDYNFASNVVGDFFNQNTVENDVENMNIEGYFQSKLITGTTNTKTWIGGLTTGFVTNTDGFLENIVYGTDTQYVRGDGTIVEFPTFSGGTFTGGTVTGSTNFTNGLTANTISATTYNNLPIDIRVTGGTYSSGTAIFTNNTGGTFSVTGFSTGNGVSITPYNNVGSATTITWNVSGVSTNYEVTLTGTSTLSLTNVRNGEYGTIIVKQDSVGNRTLSFGTVNGGVTTHKVVNGGAGVPTLTSNANATDILSFTYNGVFMFWTVGNDYN